MACEIKQAVQSGTSSFRARLLETSKVWEACQVMPPWCKASMVAKLLRSAACMYKTRSKVVDAEACAGIQVTVGMPSFITAQDAQGTSWAMLW